MFRPIYYLGCKATFADHIVDAINRVDPSGGHACDLFAGTGAVGVALSTQRPVTTVDVQEYSRVLCSAQLNPPNFDEALTRLHAESATNSAVLSRLLECLSPLLSFENDAIVAALGGDPANLVALIEAPPLVIDGYDTENVALRGARLAARNGLIKSGLWATPNTTICSYFGGTYFSFKQAAELDAILSYCATAEPNHRDTLVAAAISTASSLVNTVGKQFAQPIRPREKSGRVKPNIGAVVSRDRNLDAGKTYGEWLSKYAGLPRPTHTHNALKMSFETALRQASDYSVIYADPPYTRDHYSRFYHVLETMCLRDIPKISHVRRNEYSGPSRGAYRIDRHQSSFCIRSKAPKALDELCRLTRARGIPLVLSYSPHEAGDGTHPRVMSSKDIVEIAKQSFSRVEVLLLDGSTHNQLNRSDLGLTKRLHAEMIVECRP